MDELVRKEYEIVKEEKRRIEIKKNLISNAVRMQDEPVDDSKLVEAMFDFLPDSNNDVPMTVRGTSVFMVSVLYLK